LSGKGNALSSLAAALIADGGVTAGLRWEIENRIGLKKRQTAVGYNTRLRDADMRLAGSMRLARSDATIR
jgi:hypothetical protein